ncbi:glycosyltransferase [Magnetospirillum sp. SS-4]|uniref:glycosyltransferase family protein n=1 Tax=Magnetospirillum sp. SS-4 TaxID=2681465 RepID=UPI001383F629|nr:glycosyltransferase [Magnetospirillum sp. SS-4]CAA7623562.1 hypothetical protein MTBSS4_40268 [Magnetospirillum sp. SS-4]
MTPNDVATLAAISAGWVQDETPEPLHPGLLARIEHWRNDGALPLGALWRPILDTLRRCGCFDTEAEACRLLLSLEPDRPLFRLRLAECLHRIGRSDEAGGILSGISGPPQARAEALLLSLGMERTNPGALDELEGLLLADDDWSERHQGLIRHLADKGLTGRAEAFLTAWTGRWTFQPARLMDLGLMAMLAGNPAMARKLFTPLWVSAPEQMIAVIGRFDGSVPPYDDAIEAELTGRVEAAFALPDESLARLSPPGHDAAALPRRVMLLSFGDRDLVNDMAAHLAGSAQAAGIDLHLHLDTALTLPGEFRGDDAEVTRRIDAFDAALATLRPEVVIVDCASPLLLRGVNPAIMAELKHRHGFRLACMMRDSHRHCLSLLRAWLPACDAMVVFDPESPIFDSGHAPRNRRVIALPVPAMHGPFLAQAARTPDLGLTFAGSTAFAARLVMLSVLMTEDIPFTAVIGARRATEIPDMESYAGLLGRSAAVLNIAIHSPTDHLVTGRVWETIAAGRLLVEQANPATARFFTPWRHYLPWSNVEDIVQIARLTQRRPDLARRIGAEAHAWARRHYGAERFWNALLGHATRPDADRDFEADIRDARAWSSVTIG